MSSDPSDWAAPGSGQHRPEPGRAPDGDRPPGPQARPKPGIVPLRPLGVSEILDGAISYIRSNPVATLGLAAVVITITQLVQAPVAANLLNPAAASATDPTSADLTALLAASLGGAALSGLVSFVASTILTGLLITVLGQAVLGRRTPLAGAWAATRRRVPGLLGLALLTTLVLVAVVVVGILPGVLTAALGGSGGVVLTVVGGLAAAALAIYLGVSWSMITPAYVLEGIPAMSAFRRSYRLVRPQWWRIFGILLLGVVITTVIGFALALPFGFVTTLLDGSPDLSTGAVPTPGIAGSVVTALGTILVGAITAPFGAGITGLLYLDQRMRREAFDLELLRAAQSPDAPLPGAPDPDPGSANPPR